MASDLEKAFEALNAKQKPYSRLFAYYEGNQPLSYMSSSRMRKIFDGLDGEFSQNWCSVVIDAVKDRINLRKIEVKGAAAKTWKELWEGSQLELESDEVHEAELIAGESFIICWKNTEGQMEAYFNDPRLCHVFYDPEFPRKKSFAAKWYVDDDGKMRLTLYYANRLEYYISKGLAKNATKAAAFIEMDPPSAENPFGEIPVFHFRKSKQVRSDLKNVVPIQNSVNKLVTDMMVAAEFGAFKQRYVISNAEVQGKLKNSPDEIWDLPAGDGVGQQTQAGQFDATPLSNYLEGIEKQVVAISSITRTPKHYFFQIGSNISGEALIAMESSLNKKAQDRIDRYAPEWKSVTLFMLKHSGNEVNASDVTVRFDRPETIQPYTQAQTRQLNFTGGIPLETTLREEGKSDDEIKQVLADVEKQKTRDANLAQAYLDKARQNFDQNAGGGQKAVSGTQNAESGMQNAGGNNA
ncbi:MAG: phage portal protein [Chloroflexi bacterium]|nr:phage portal protein [Chloroflexota bacterium]